MEENVALDKKHQSKFAKKMKKINAKIKSSALSPAEEKPKKQSESTRGTVYIGHIPHGFYEKEMLAYFKQFGKVTNVRVCRSKATGQSKGYAFVEFLHSEVAEVVADTMNNYLMFNRRLVAQYTPTKTSHKRLFHKKPWSATNYPAKKLRQEVNAKRNQNLTDVQQAKKNKEMISKINKNLQKLRDLGIDYDFKVADDGSQELFAQTNGQAQSTNEIIKVKTKITGKKLKRTKVPTKNVTKTK